MNKNVIFAGEYDGRAVRAYCYNYDFGNGMNVLDILLIIIFCLFVLRSLFNGFVREVFSISALIVGLVMANNYYQVGELLITQKGWASPFLAGIFSYVVIFILFSIGVILIGRLVQKLLGKLELSWLDRLGGSVLGLFKGLLIGCILVLSLTLILPAKSPFLRESRLTPHILSVIRTLTTLVPEGYREVIKKKEDALKKLKSSILSTINDQDATKPADKKRR